MTIMADAPMAVTAITRPPLPRRPVPHERTPDRPTPTSPRPHPRTAGATGRHDDRAARQLLDALYRQYAPMVVATAARALRPADRDLANDIAQQAWLDAWVLLLRGEELHSPAGFLGCEPAAARLTTTGSPASDASRPPTTPTNSPCTTSPV